MKKHLYSILIGLLAVLLIASPIYAATTAGFNVTFTPANVQISDNVTDLDFGDWAGNGYGVVYLGSTVNTTTNFCTVTNVSNIQTDHTISFTTANWSSDGGTELVHSNTATAGADTAGMLANRGGTWGTGDVIIESDITGTPNLIYEDCPASTSFSYGVGLQVPDSVSSYDEKSGAVLDTAAAG